jgi:hypothetical protein
MKGWILNYLVFKPRAQSAALPTISAHAVALRDSASADTVLVAGKSEQRACCLSGVRGQFPGVSRHAIWDCAAKR